MKLFLKEYVWFFFQPSIFLSLLCGISLLLLYRSKTKFAKCTLSLAGILFLVCTLDPLPEYLLSKMEGKYRPFVSTHHSSEIKYIVVLAGGFIPGGEIPLSAQLPSTSLVRLVEGIRIQKKLPNSKLILTGKGWAEISEAQAMRDMALSLGLNTDNILLEEKSMNTYEHTVNLKNILPLKKNFILVTSAIHMPRAMALFKSAGFSPIAAPTNHILVGDYKPFRIATILPSFENLHAMDQLCYEYFALLWAKLSGKIK